MFDFPSSPSSGQIYQPGVGMPVWQWDGAVWRSVISGIGVRAPQQIAIVASGTYMPSPGCTDFTLEGCGGGGGGGAAAGGATTTSAAGGGGSGGCGVTAPIKVVPGQSATITIGTGGTSGAVGTNTTIVYNGVTYTLYGGGAGTSLGGAGLGTNYVQNGGNCGGTTGPWLKTSGEPGGDGFVCGYSSVCTTIKSGQGGGTPYGFGGANQRISSSGVAPGYNASGYGAGGGGGLSFTQAGSGAGGNGAPGIVIATEYFMGETSTQLVPSGSILDYAGVTAPSGWLLCYGQSLATATYPDLFAAIGYTYGGSGANFSLPDCRGRASIGKDNMGGTSANRVTVFDGDVLGQVGGAETHTLLTAEIPAHTHSDAGHAHGITDPTHAHSYTWRSTLVTTSTGTGNRWEGAAANTTGYSATGISINTGYASLTNTGGGGAHNNMPPSIVFNKIIKT